MSDAFSEFSLIFLELILFLVLVIIPVIVTINFIVIFSRASVCLFFYLSIIDAIMFIMTSLESAMCFIIPVILFMVVIS